MEFYCWERAWGKLQPVRCVESPGRSIPEAVKLQSLIVPSLFYCNTQSGDSTYSGIDSIKIKDIISKKPFKCTLCSPHSRDRAEGLLVPGVRQITAPLTCDAQSSQSFRSIFFFFSSRASPHRPPLGRKSSSRTDAGGNGPEVCQSDGPGPGSAQPGAVRPVYSVFAQK